VASAAERQENCVCRCFFPLKNIRSISSKVDELETTLHINDIDIAEITETWLNDSIPHELCEIDNCKYYRRDHRDGRRGGGLCCLARSALTLERLYELDSPDVESLWLLYRARRMPRRAFHIATGIYYHPPEGENRQTVQNQNQQTMTRVDPYSGIVLMGEFNNLLETNIFHILLNELFTV
jgi:hypothetical protein